MLLTADDMIRRAHYRNAQRTLERLLGLDVLPVVNENDTVATDEIRVGDNDRLAALVAHIVGADALVLLSDVDGLYDGDPAPPRSRLLREVDDAADLDAVTVARAGSGWARGGMATKITAAAMASACGDPGAAGRGRGRRPPRWTRPATGRRSARRSARRGGGCRRDDSGCATPPTCAAVSTSTAARPRPCVHRRRSLLAAGIRGVSGDFVAGDVVDLVDPDGTVVARGVVGFDAAELPDLIGRSSHELPSAQRREVVHADDLVPMHTP